MPYIAEPRRFPLSTGQVTPQNVGELTYLLYRLAGDYLREHGESYQRYAEVQGALASTAMELYRRGQGPYEDGAIDRNGDIEW